MAGFAAKLCPIRPAALHAVSKLPVMWVSMTSSTGFVFKVKRNNLVCSSADSHFVTFHTSHRNVRACQRELGFLVFGDGEESAVKVRHGVAALAPVLERLSSKLAVVGILVTVHTARELDFVNRFLACGNVAFGAFYFYVLSFQRIL